MLILTFMIPYYRTHCFLPSPAPNMVFISLDNIIHYDPSSSKIPPKPPNTPSVVSDGLSSFKQPPLMKHPLPPRPPLHYHHNPVNPLFSPVSLTQSPTQPVVSSRPPPLSQNAGSCSPNSGYHERPNHTLQNDSDTELVNLKQLEIEHQVTSETHVNYFNQQLDDRNSDIQVQDLDISHNGK